MDVALSLPADDAALLETSARRHGHRVVARAHSDAELLDTIAGSGAGLVVALASPHHLTSRMIERCDSLGIPIAPMCSLSCRWAQDS